MKIAAFYSNSHYASWSQSYGFGRALRRMGHDVTEIPVPVGVKQVKRAEAVRINKPIDDCELIIVSGPEHLSRWILQFYPGWTKLKAPKVGWYHESFVREDYTLDFEQYKPWIDVHFFPDKRDADKYQGHFLPLGIDPEIFTPFQNDPLMRTCPTIPVRDIDAAFIGLLYPKRARFYEEVRQCGAQIRIANGNIAVTDMDGVNVERSTELLASQYRRIHTFVTFPSLSNVLVAKILESMACGCVLVAPKQPIELDNYLPYETPKECAEQIKRAAHITTMGSQGAVEAGEHSMENRFTDLFSKVGVNECVTA